MKNPKIKKILYATDMGEHMRPVFRFAIDMANTHKSKIIMLHVVEPLSSGALLALDVYMPKTNTKKVLQDGMKKSLKRMQSRLNRFCKDENISDPTDGKIISKVKVVSGHCAEMIIKQAEEMKVDLIVVGKHTSPSLHTMLMGSTARKVTQLSKIPVLVVPVYE